MKKRKETSFQQQVFSMITQYIGEYKKLTIPQPFLKFFGNHDTAVFFSQMIFWCDKGKSQGGFIFKSYREWYEETGLTEYRVKRCVERLKDMGILDTKLKQANGFPTIHYKLNRKDFLNAFLKFLRNEREYLKKRNLNISDSITEPTTEITTELTKNNNGRVNSASITFNEYRKKYSIDEEAIRGIQYFLERYKQHIDKKHPNLKREQWQNVVDTLFTCSDDYYDRDFDISLAELEKMIDKYFSTEFQEGCNYSILHFNSTAVKIRRMYESAG